MKEFSYLKKREISIIELYQTIMRWINGVSENFEVPKDIKEYLDDFKQIVELKLRN